MADRKFDVSILLGVVDKASNKFKKIGKQVKIMAVAAAAAGAVMIAGAIKAAKAAGIQEQAELTLAQAMKQAGTFTEEAFQHNLKYASSLQKVTTFGDETILSVQKMLTNFAIEGKELDSLTKATLDLAAAKGMDLRAAADLVAKSVGSSTNALIRYGIKVEGAVGSTERAQTAAENITKLFGGAARAQAETYAGRVQQISNRWGDFIEKIGFLVIPILEKLLKIINNYILPMLEDWIGDVEISEKAAEAFAKSLQFLIKIAMGVVAAFDILGDANNALALAMTLRFNDAKLAFTLMGDKVTEWGEKFNKLTNLQLQNDTKRSESNKKLQTQITTQSKAEIEALMEVDKEKKKAEEEEKKRLDERKKAIDSFQADVAAGWSSHIEAMIKGTESFAEGVKGFAQTVGNAIIRLAAEEAAEFIVLQAAKAIAAAYAAHAGIPVVGLALGAAAAAAVVAEINRAKSEAGLAEGGLTTGATRALIGESGPEVVLPLDNPRAKRKLAMAGIGGHTFLIRNNTFIGEGGLDDLKEMLGNMIMRDVANERNY